MANAKKIGAWNSTSLYKKHSIAQLNEMRKALCADPANRNTEVGSIFIYTRTAHQRLDAIARAIYFHMQDGKLSERANALNVKIAAAVAPELLRALQKLVPRAALAFGALASSFDVDEELAEARAAIAKATRNSARETTHG